MPAERRVRPSGMTRVVPTVPRPRIRDGRAARACHRQTMPRRREVHRATGSLARLDTGAPGPPDLSRTTTAGSGRYRCRGRLRTAARTNGASARPRRPAGPAAPARRRWPDAAPARAVGHLDRDAEPRAPDPDRLDALGADLGRPSRHARPHQRQVVAALARTPSPGAPSSRRRARAARRRTSASSAARGEPRIGARQAGQRQRVVGRRAAVDAGDEVAPRACR